MTRISNIPISFALLDGCYVNVTGDTMTGALTVPTIIGGTGTTSDLTLQTTSGVGATGADMHFLVGNNGATEAMTILNNGNVGIGTTEPTSGLHIVSATGIKLDGGSGGSPAITWYTSGTGNLRGTIFNDSNSDFFMRAGYNNSGNLQFQTITGGSVSTRLYIKNNGNVGIGVTGPTAVFHLKAGTATANTAPLKFNSGTLNTTAEAGAVEFLTDDFYATITTSAARKAFVLDDGTRLTSGKIPVATTNGRLIDVTPQTELTDELTTITFTAPGTPDYAVADLTQTTPYGFASADEGQTVLSVIANLQTRVNELETKLVALGLLADAD